MIDGFGRNPPPRLQGPPNVPGVGVATTQQSAAASASAKAPLGGRTSSVTVQLRDVARSMAAKPPVDAARVAELRAAMISGRFRVDPEAIAARMIAFDRGSGRG